MVGIAVDVMKTFIICAVLKITRERHEVWCLHERYTAGKEYMKNPVAF